MTEAFFDAVMAALNDGKPHVDVHVARVAERIHHEEVRRLEQEHATERARLLAALRDKHEWVSWEWPE